MTINIDYHLENEGLSDSVLALVKSNLKVVPYTIYKLESDCSSYSYTDDQLRYSNDHIRQLITDIILANLDKVRCRDLRIYKYLKEGNIKDGPFYYVVSDDLILSQVYIDYIASSLEQEYDDENYEYSLMDYTYYIKVNSGVGTTFINNLTMTKHSRSKDKFFQTEEEAINYLKENK